MSAEIRRYRDGAGYDHPWLDWEPDPSRTALAWPGNARLAVMILLHVEHYDLDPPAGRFADPRFGGALGSYRPDYNNYTRRLYGARVGVWRILDMLKRRRLRATVAIGAEAAERYGAIVERARADGHGFVAHGTDATAMISSRMDEAGERAFITDATDRIASAIGRRPRGWAGQDYGESERTPGLLAGAGFDHVIDWPNDDRPLLMNTDPRLVSIPPQSEWDDAELFAVRKVDAWRYPGIIADAAECLIGEGGRLLTLAVRPWIFGQPHRAGHLDRALAHLTELEGVWNATSDQIADVMLESPAT